MKAPSPHYSYEQFSVMPIAQKRRVYIRDKKNIKALVSVPFALMVLAVFVFGVVGWLGIAATIYSHSYIDFGVTKFIHFIAFAIAGGAISVQGERRFVIPLAFLIYTLLDTLIHMEFSPILVLMLAYVFFASEKVARYEADLNILKQFDGYPFLNKSDDGSLNTYRNDEVIKTLEKTVYYAQHPDDTPPADDEGSQREEYTQRRW